MTATVDDFKARFPEFSDEDEFPKIRIQLFLDDVVTLYLGSDEARWRGKYNIAHAYYAAHLLSTGTSSEAGAASANVGPVTSKSAGGVSVSKSVVAKDRSEGDDFLMATTYGQQFISIRNVCFAGALVANQL